MIAISVLLFQIAGVLVRYGLEKLLVEHVGGHQKGLFFTRDPYFPVGAGCYQMFIDHRVSVDLNKSILSDKRDEIC